MRDRLRKSEVVGEKHDILNRVNALRKSLEQQLQEATKYHRECQTEHQEMIARLKAAEIEARKSEDVNGSKENSQSAQDGSSLTSKKSIVALRRVCRSKEKLSRGRKLLEFSKNLERCCLFPDCLQRPCEPYKPCQECGVKRTIIYIPQEFGLDNPYKECHKAH
ncbi:uncharacterized protein LOC105697739 [Orussus abietinus]|uniref:uncharacterized protein LOC105697739 n=1 Tax=Orussus abietinus TaxID=222816 RepID=UPI000626DFC3|nr:uncharacterized protein LOC105697739 [Orussus abietinus]